MIASVTEGVGRIDGGIPPVGERTPRERRKSPFPELPDSGEPETSEEDDAAKKPARREPPADDDDSAPHVDILVAARGVGYGLPRRQLLPPSPSAVALH
jgi:hypothetical protein